MFWQENYKEKDHLEGLSIDGTLVLRTFKKISEWGLHLSGAGQVPVAYSCDRSNEPLGSTTEGKFHEVMRKYCILTKDSGLWS
jgi:hypothetical protein